jgi:signal transduction histidine kinase
VSLTVSPIKDSAGAIVGASSIARDITQRKRYERELQEADRRKDEFLGMLAHELRNPLAIISNASQVLDCDATLNPRAEKLRSMITRQTQVLARIVDDLLDVSRLSRGKINLNSQPAEINGEVVFTVQDTGIGISPDMLPRVFDLFAQADHSFDRSQGGLGIGLSLVQTLTKMHGGPLAHAAKG